MGGVPLTCTPVMTDKITAGHIERVCVCQWGVIRVCTLSCTCVCCSHIYFVGVAGEDASRRHTVTLAGGASSLLTERYITDKKSLRANMIFSWWNIKQSEIVCAVNKD